MLNWRSIGPRRKFPAIADTDVKVTPPLKLGRFIKSSGLPKSPSTNRRKIPTVSCSRQVNGGNQITGAISWEMGFIKNSIGVFTSAWLKKNERFSGWNAAFLLFPRNCFDEIKSFALRINQIFSWINIYN